MDDVCYAALAPAGGEVFGAWGEFFPWPRYLDVETTLDALRVGLATRETRQPVTHEWTLHDVDGDTVARLKVTAIDAGGLLGTLVIEGRYPLAEAVVAARAAPHALPGASDIPETSNRVDPGALADLTARSETEAALGTIVLRVYEGCVWWGPET